MPFKRSCMNESASEYTSKRASKWASKRMSKWHALETEVCTLSSTRIHLHHTGTSRLYQSPMFFWPVCCYCNADIIQFRTRPLSTMEGWKKCITNIYHPELSLPSWHLVAELWRFMTCLISSFMNILTLVSMWSQPHNILRLFFSYFKRPSFKELLYCKHLN